MTNDGLVTFQRTAGPAGGGIVPDLAQQVLKPTDNGRTYSFQLRPGIRYSTGQLVRASDFRASIERMIAIGKAPPDYGSIEGADQCTSKGHPCDLSRNPMFSQWSAAAQPAGYPDRIDVRRVANRGGGAPDADVAAVAAGRYDWTPDAMSSRKLAELLPTRTSQLHAYPTSVVRYLFLNTSLHPFNDVRVRRAVNLAVDRRAAVRALGGAGLATETCQSIAPSLFWLPRLLSLHRRPEPGWSVECARSAESAAPGSRGTRCGGARRCCRNPTSAARRVTFRPRCLLPQVEHGQEPIGR